jgi:hypothetical protein
MNKDNETDKAKEMANKIDMSVVVVDFKPDVGKIKNNIMESTIFSSHSYTLNLSPFLYIQAYIYIIGS